MYTLDQLQPGHRVQGPALLIDNISTIVVEPQCTAEITGDRNVRIELLGKGRQGGLLERDPVQLAIFSHRCHASCARHVTLFTPSLNPEISEV